MKNRIVLGIALGILFSPAVLANDFRLSHLGEQSRVEMDSAAIHCGPVEVQKDRQETVVRSSKNQGTAESSRLR